MLPEETELLERDIQMERKKRAEARKERFADEPVSFHSKREFVAGRGEMEGAEEECSSGWVTFLHLSR